MPLTGRFWFRRTWTGRLVLLVEERRPKRFSRRDAFTLRWRDARLLDFAEPQLRPLLSLEHSFRPPSTATAPAGLRVVADVAKAKAPTPVAAAA